MKVIIDRWNLTYLQSEEDRGRSLESVKQMYDEYRPTKHHLDLLRQSIGLEPTADLHDEGIKLTPGKRPFIIYLSREQVKSDLNFYFTFK